MSSAKFEREPLQRAPLLEAVLDVRARCQTPYTFVPGELRLKLSGFPTIEQSPLVGTTAEGPHHRFKSEDGTRLIQTGPNFFSAHVLGDYGEWDLFAAFLRDGLAAFREVAKPERTSRVALRYINLLPEDLLEGVSEPLALKVEVPRGLQAAVRRSAARVELETAHGSIGLAIAAPAEVSGGRKGLLLDLELFLAKEEEFAVDATLDWAKLAHDDIYQVFRTVLDPDLHERMRRSPAA